MIGGDLLGGVGGAIGGIIGLATMGDGGEDELEEAVRLWKAIQSPEFDMRELAPYQLRIVAEYFPETYEAIVPQGVELPEAAPEGRAAEMGALRRLEETAREGLPLSERLAADEAGMRVSDSFTRSAAGARNNLAARGRLGGGTEGVMRAIAGQQSADLARGMGSDLAREAIATRQAATRDAGAMGSRIRSEDFGEAATRAGATNRFNELVAQARQRAVQDATASRERAMAGNVEMANRVAQQNELGRYGNELENLTRRNALRQAEFGNEVTKAQGTTGALGDLASARYAEQAARLNTAQSIGAGVGKTAGGVLDIFGGGF